MNISFTEAIVISIMLHSVLFLPIFNKNLPLHVARQKDSVIVDYIKYKEPAPAARETPEIVTAPKVEMKQAVNTPAAKLAGPPAKEVADILAVRQARIMGTKDYIGYNQLIREKIRQKMKDKYRAYYGEGDVALIFTLRADGALISASVDPRSSTSDRNLVSTALRSLKEAAPFARFPKALTLSQMSFTITVSFKKQ